MTIGRRPFREAPNASEALALDARLFSVGPSRAFSPIMFDCAGTMSAESDDAGIVTIAVRGPLEHHSSWWWHSYEDLLVLASAASRDPSTRAIILDIDSPGGVVAGLDDCTRELARIDARMAKGDPRFGIYSYGRDMACSAAYHLACGTRETWTGRSGVLGSIGVIRCVIDETEALARDGVKVQYVVTGARKADFHPGQPVTAEMVAVAQRSVDKLGRMFFRTVARSRGGSPDDYRALQAGVFTGSDAQAAGLADGIASWAKFRETVKASLSSSASTPNRATVPLARGMTDQSVTERRRR